MSLKNKKVEEKKTPAPSSSNTLEQLHIKLGQLADESKEITNTAEAEKRELSADELARLDEIKVEFNRTEKEINVRAAVADMGDRVNALTVPQQRITQPEDMPEGDVPQNAAPARRITGGLPVGTSKGTFGFRSMGDWALAARRHKGGHYDQRILNAPSSFGQEGINEDGGFAVPPEFRSSILKLIQGEDSLISRTDQQTISGNSLSLPLDATTPWQTSGGVLPSWVGEGAAITPTKPKLGTVEVKAHKLAALVPLTEELMADAPALTSWLNSKVPEKFVAVINEAIINGDGVAKPLGMLNAGCKVTVSASANGAANTVKAQNIVDMWGRSYGPMRSRAVWFINQDVEAQLQTMVLPGSSPTMPAYMPPGGLSTSPYATLFGRPVVTLEACQALGTEGDIILAIPDQYLTVVKGGMRTDVSMHLYFDTDHTAFKFVMRVGGQSYWPAAVARAHGSNTLSPIVTLNSTRT